MIKCTLKKILRVFMIFIILGILGIITVLSINGYIISTSKKRIISLEQASNLDEVDCILVLGRGMGDRPTLCLKTA